MKKSSTIFLTLLCALLASCTTSSWSDQERSLINAARYSRMELTTIDNQADSLLLRTPSTPLTKSDILSPVFGRLAASMIETVCDEGHRGVGIAAPQVGILRRVVVVQRLDKKGGPFEIYVNPEIVWRSEECATGGEGCLSVPNKRSRVLRHTAIDITYNDAITFAPCKEHIEGFVAVIFQHEIDHLDGVLYIDKTE